VSKKLNRRLQQLDRGRPAPAYPGATQEDEPPISWLNFVFFTIVVFLVILGASLFFGVRSVQSDLVARATTALHLSGYKEVDVRASGHDLQLVGVVTPQQSIDDAVSLISHLPGVGTISANLHVMTPSDPGTTQVTGRPIVVSWSKGSATIEGDVSSEEIKSFVLDGLASTFDSVDDSGLGVLDGLDDETPWVGTVVAVLDDAAAALPEGQLLVNPTAEVVQLSGHTDSRQVRRELETKARERIEALGFAFTPGIVLPEAPPPKAQVVQLQTNLDTLLEGKVVEFETGSAVITDAGQRLLDDVLETLRMFPAVPIEIAGHADAQGSPEANMTLSEQRAQAVLDYLVAHGADPNRFVVVGYGDTRPIADNSTAEGRQKNRRIEFIALEE